VLFFNIWESGKGPGGLARVAEIVREANADIIGLSELMKQKDFETLSELLAHPSPNSKICYRKENMRYYGDRHLCIISKFEIQEVFSVPKMYGFGTILSLNGNLTVRVIVCHLSAYPYGPYLIRDETSDKNVMDEEMKKRVPEIKEILARLCSDYSNETESVGTFLLGDHNAPSHLDWKDDIKHLRFNRSFNWPVSQILSSHGFIDAYRELYHEVTHHPGYTWSPGYPKGTFSSNEVFDRIDYIYYRQPLAHHLHSPIEKTNSVRKTLAPYSFTISDPDPFPSDHYMIFSEFEIISNNGKL